MEDKDFATRALSDGIWGDEMNPTDTPRTDALIALGFTREALDQAIDSHAELERELSAARQEIAALELERGTVLATEKGDYAVFDRYESPRLASNRQAGSALEGVKCDPIEGA